MLTRRERVVWGEINSKRGGGEGQSGWNERLGIISGGSELELHARLSVWIKNKCNT